MIILSKTQSWSLGLINPLIIIIYISDDFILNLAKLLQNPLFLNLIRNYWYNLLFSLLENRL